MYCIIAHENPNNYILGYYKPMTKDADYIYSVKFLATKDNSKIAFVPTQSITGDYFGISPYVSTKLFNSNGYVIPITLPTKGYYNISIDIQNKTYSITPWTPTGTNSYANSVRMYANNDISWGVWVASPAMTPDVDNQFVLRGVIPITGASGIEVKWFCFATNDWSMSWRPDSDSPNTVTSWFAFAGNGKSLNIISMGVGDYPVIFDMSPSAMWGGMWVTIKKQ